MFDFVKMSEAMNFGTGFVFVDSRPFGLGSCKELFLMEPSDSVCFFTDVEFLDKRFCLPVQGGEVAFCTR